MVEGSTVIAVASREIGYQAGKNGHNKYGEWFGLDCVPYCMEFVQWVYHTAGMNLPLKTASCGGLLRWYQRNQPECIVSNPIQGSICIFDLPKTQYNTDHTGLYVRSDQYTVTSIDGNTRNGSGSDSNGGWVQQRTRKIKDIENIWFIHPRGLVLVDWDKAIADMTDEQAYKLYCKADKHMATLPLPTSWNAKEELDEAKAIGITDGSNPLCLTPRYQTAIMIKRAVKKK